MDQNPVSRKREIITTLVVLLVIAGVVGAVVVTNKKKSTNSGPLASASQQQTAATMPATGTAGDSTAANTDATGTGGGGTGASSSSNASTGNYKNGSYSATGSYESPGGTEKITIRVSLQSGVITDTSATSGAIDGEGQEYQNDFIRGYKQQVVGKSIDSLSLSRVSGSSLTSQGFNDAISQIKQQAHA
jgi:hypothetical protein